MDIVATKTSPAVFVATDTKYYSAGSRTISSHDCGDKTGFL